MHLSVLLVRCTYYVLIGPVRKIRIVCTKYSSSSFWMISDLVSAVNRHQSRKIEGVVIIKVKNAHWKDTIRGKQDNK